MKTSTLLALHLAAAAALTLTVGCQTVQSRGHKSLFGGGRSQPTEGDVAVLPGETADVTPVKPLATAPTEVVPPTPVVPVQTPVVTPSKPAEVKPAEVKPVPPPTVIPATPTVKPVDVRPVADIGKPGSYPEFVNVPKDLAKQPVVHAKDLQTGNLPKPVSDTAPMITPVPTQPDGAPALPKIVKTYVVVAGDTLGGIAQKHGVRTADLLKVNSMADANKIRVGQRINIPEATPGVVIPSSTPKKTVVAPEGGSVHTVAKGEIIGSIAHKYGLKTGDVLRANGLTEETAKKIKVGQKLIIPAKTAENTYTPSSSHNPAANQDQAPVTPRPTPPTPVAPTLQPVAQTVAPPVAQTPKPVAPTQPVVKPVVTPPAPQPQLTTPPTVPVVVPPVPTVSAPTSNEARTYIVKEGENLRDIADRYNVTKFALITLNGFSVNHEVKAGDSIKVPAN